MMPSAQRDILERNRLKLVRSVQMTASLLAALRSDYTVTNEMQEEIMAATTSADKVGRLLDTLGKRGRNAFERFIIALVESDQDEVAQLLDQNHAQRYINARDQQRQTQLPQPAPGQYMPYAAPPGMVPVMMPVMVPAGVTVPGTVPLQAMRPNLNDQWQHQESASNQRQPDSNQRQPVSSNECGLGTQCSTSEMHSGTKDFVENSPVDVQVALQEINAGSIMQFSVKFATQHCRSQMAGSYNMSRGSRGLAIIISNKFFVHEGLMERVGSEFDVVNLCELFKQLQFETEVYEELSAEEMRRTLTNLSQSPKHVNADAFVLFILSHGTQGFIYGRDACKVSVYDIMSMFDGKHCPQLAGKPKLFFVQACQGKERSYQRVPVDQPEGPVPDAEMTPVVTEDVQRMLQELSIEDQSGCVERIVFEPHQKADMMLAYATVAGYEAWRNTELGSWFVRCIVYVFSHKAHEEHVLDMLTEVNNLLSHLRTSGTTQRYRQIAEKKDTFMKKLYFLPGYVG